MNEAEIAGSRFIVARRQSAGAFELVKAAFDAVSQGIRDGIDEDRFLAVDRAGDDGRAAALFDDPADIIAVVTAVGDEHFRLGQVIVDQCIKALEIGDFATAYFRPDRQSVSVGNEVDLGREAAF